MGILDFFLFFCAVCYCYREWNKDVRFAVLPEKLILAVANSREIEYNRATVPSVHGRYRVKGERDICYL